MDGRTACSRANRSIDDRTRAAENPRRWEVRGLRAFRYTCAHYSPCNGLGCDHAFLYRSRVSVAISPVVVRRRRSESADSGDTDAVNYGDRRRWRCPVGRPVASARGKRASSTGREGLTPATRRDTADKANPCRYSSARCSYLGLARCEINRERQKEREREGKTGASSRVRPTLRANRGGYFVNRGMHEGRCASTTFIKISQTR